MEEEAPKKLTAYECNICSEFFNSKDKIRLHIYSEHLNTQSEGNNLCPLCDIYCTTYKKIEKHLRDVHGSKITIEKLEFTSYEEFKTWKRQEEIQTHSQYNTRSSSGSSRNYHVYLCHRSGYARRQGTGAKRRHKPTEKLDRCCPARITTSVVGNRLKVVFHKTHFGHDEANTLKLTEEQRNRYEELISKKDTLNTILTKVRAATQRISEVRLRTVLQRDKQFVNGVEPFSNVVPEKDGLHEWVIDQVQRVDSCVLSYRSETEEYVHCYDWQKTIDEYSFEKGEFLLILMTNRQGDVINGIEQKNVVLDCCRGVTEYTFEVAALILVDEFGNGCPVAFCLTSNLCAKSIKHFVSTVRGSVGKISAKVLMTVDEPELYESWTEIMGSVENFILCSWDVTNKWRSQLTKVVEFGLMNKIEIYHACCLLLERVDIKGFADDLEAFLRMCYNHPETVEFGEYFRKTFLIRPEKWALCYRNGFNIKNHKLELLHRRLEFCYRASGARLHRTLEKCVNKLLQIGDEMSLVRMIQKAKMPTKIADVIASNHKRGENIAADMIIQKADNVWLVAGKFKVETVSVTPEIQCRSCQFKCILCRHCFHQFSCTCEAYIHRGAFCEHSHACFRLMLQREKDSKCKWSESKNDKLRSLKEALGSITTAVSRLTEDTKQAVHSDMQKLYDLTKKLSLK